MRGAGTADVFKDSHSQILIVRSWLHDPQDSQGCLVLAEQPLNHPIPIGPLIADSMTIAILFAAETGQGFHLPTGIDVARQSGEISIDPGGLIVRTGRKRLNCFHDEVETSAGLARRIHILT
jgi:hypothetical protein